MVQLKKSNELQQMLVEATETVIGNFSKLRVKNKSYRK